MRHVLFYLALVVGFSTAANVLIIANGARLQETSYQRQLADVLEVDHTVTFIRLDRKGHVGEPGPNDVIVDGADDDRSLYEGFIGLKKHLKGNYDIVIHQHDDLYANGIAQHLGAKIALSRNGPVTRNALRMIGAQVFSTLNPDESQGIPTNHNVIDRVVSFVTNGIQWVRSYYPSQELEHIRKQLTGVGKYPKADFLFVSSNKYWEPANLYPPNVAFARVQTVKVDSKTKKTIVVDADVPEGLFSALPTHSFTVTSSVRTQKLPANAHSGHFSNVIGKASLLITNGAHDAILDAASLAVPILVLPRTNEEFRNAELAVARGVAEIFLFENATLEAFSEAVESSLKLTEAALRVSETIKTSPIESSNVIRTAIRVLSNNIDLSIEPCFFKIASVDIFLVFLVAFVILKVLLGWYYWSCFELNKLKLE